MASYRTVCFNILKRCNKISGLYQVRYYARGLKRRPVSVMTAAESELFHQEGKKKAQSNESNKDSPSYFEGFQFNHEIEQTGKNDENRPSRFLLPSHIRYEKLQEADKRFGPVIMATKSRKSREKTGNILVEGARLIKEAMNAGVQIKNLYFTRVELLEGFPWEEVTDINLYKVFPGHMKIWSDMVSLPGIMAICQRPKFGDLKVDEEHQLPITLICDNVRDPGNMGTLIRSAAAVGCKKVLATKGCVDVWEPKVLRSAAGAHFYCHIINNLGWEMVGNYLSPDSKIHIADNISDASTSIIKPRKSEVKKVMESVTEKHIQVNEETGESIEIDLSYRDKSTVELYKKMPIHVMSYSEVDYDQGEVVIVVGGETEGLSADAHKLAFDNGGDKIYVPIVPRIESLNAAMAGSVILFEVKRQLMESRNNNVQQKSDFS